MIDKKTDGQKILAVNITPAMEPCTCKSRILRIYDPSGNEREEYPVGVPGWHFYLECQVGCPYVTWQHQDDCLTSRNPVPMIDLSAFPSPSRTHVGNGTYKGAFAFTLNKSPSDPYTVGDMMIAVRKIMSQKSCPVIKYAWYYEEKGRDANNDPIHPHIHGMYETESGYRIETKHFKRAWPIWDPASPMGAGFRGGYHRPVRSDEGYSNYIKKDGMMGESKQ